MRLILWAPVLAAVAEALPGVSSRPSSSSAASSTSSTSSSISQPTRALDGSLKYVCDNGGDTTKNWLALDMPGFVNRTSTLWCDDKKLCPYGPYKLSWPETLANEIDKRFQCEIGSYDCQLNFNQDECTNDWNTRMLFTLLAVQHFHDWINQVIDALDSAKGDFATMLEHMVTKFSSHKVDESGSQAMGFTIAAGVMAVAAAFLGPLAPVGLVTEGTAASAATAGLAGGAGSLSGGSTLGIAATNAMALQVGETLQTELNHMGQLGVVMKNAFNQTTEAISTIAGKAINERPSNGRSATENPYKDDPLSGPGLLHSGDFASGLNYTDIIKVKRDTSRIFNQIALGVIWREFEWVYIGKLATKFDGYDPCDIPLKNLHRECKDGVAYFFVTWHDKPKDEKWPYPQGSTWVDEDDNVDLYQMAQAAEYNQQTFGYDHRFDPNTAAQHLTQKDIPGGSTMVNLPVCYMDNRAYKFGGKNSDYDTDLKELLHKECTTIPRVIKDWPYPFNGNSEELSYNNNKNPYTDDAQDSVIFNDKMTEVIWAPPSADLDLIGWG